MPHTLLAKPLSVKQIHPWDSSPVCADAAEPTLVDDSCVLSFQQAVTARGKRAPKRH